MSARCSTAPLVLDLPDLTLTAEAEMREKVEYIEVADQFIAFNPHGFYEYEPTGQKFYHINGDPVSQETFEAVRAWMLRLLEVAEGKR